METKISYIHGRIGIPRNGVIRCDDSTLTLLENNNVIFEDKLNDIRSIKYMTGLNLAIQTSTGKTYLLSEVDWGNKNNILKWFGMLIFVVGVIIASNVVAGWFFSQQVTRFIMLSVTFLFGVPFIFWVYSSGLKKVASLDTKPSTETSLADWKEYFIRVCPAKVSA